MSEPVPQKPYLLRAIFEWCVDNGFTPYLSVVVDEATRVPVEYVRNGEIVLNVGPLAANKLKMGNEMIEFAARFGGTARELMIPISQVSAIYARENGHGMSFEVEKKSKPGWEVASTGLNKPDIEPRRPDVPATSPIREVVSTTEPPADDPKPPAPGGGRPSLRRVK